MRPIKNKISFLVLFNYFYKSIIRDKPTIILISLSFSFSLVISLILFFFNSLATKLEIFNYFFIFSMLIVLFILVIRVVQIIFNYKIQNQTIFMIIIQQVNRINLFLAMWVSMIMFCASVLVVNVLLQFTFAFFTDYSNYILKFSSVYLLYGIIESICLVTFILFISLIFKSNVVSVMSSLILTFSFIGSLPYQFLLSSEKQQKIQIKKAGVSSPISYYIEDIYNIFDLQENIEKENIRFPNLAKYINNDFLQKEYYKGNDFNKRIDERLKLWSDLNILITPSEEEKLYTSKRLKIGSVKDSGLTEFDTNDIVTVELYYNRKFLTIEEINELIKTETDEYKKNILIEFVNFYNEIIYYFRSEEQIVEIKYLLFGDLMDLDLEKTLIKKTDGSATQNLSKASVQAIFWNYYSNNSSGNLFFLNDQEYGENLEELIENMYNPVEIVVRILEEYFIRYTSDFLTITNNPVIIDESWQSYVNRRRIYNGLFIINPFSNLILNYTYFAGKEYDEIWFKPSATSKISYTEKDNFFLPYKTYSFVLEDEIISPTSYKNFINPLIYILIQLAIALILLIISGAIFRRIDFR